MAPTILIVGATGNTGRSVVETLPELLAKSQTLSSHNILALTRSKSGAAAQKLAQLPGVELEEQNWVEITETWLRERNITRIFIASHNEPLHFAEESQFLVNALQAGVKYVVRISTTTANVTPTCKVYYPRAHWAIEQMLSSPEFSEMHFSSLQPAIFQNMTVAPMVEWVKKFKETGKQNTFRTYLDPKAPIAIVDSDDVGVLAAHLLSQDDTTPFNHKRLSIYGPEDVTGEQLVKLVEKHIGEKIQDVSYRDWTFLDEFLKGHPSTYLMSYMHDQAYTLYDGSSNAAATSREVVALAPPKGKITELLQKELAGI
ncbi:hypothetical protein CB0940_09850 [Cercospora beticola]|uniref:NmrA-like domain-containing protein n=1 Tax=Cercospora beticola TaxID=122368 RepID=A0A2G5HHE5_CERBT|nr:hypothetical protein CB0940_09850 [Cercospora beticola]PIA91915.1 hypothetical protein CB0940_09850 [Cercospora beticola]WPB05803.1 hypothetical protein RHO25_010457 [Cercospora beticola]CAK1365663.1 unnamed protein product [Cercospora beticola]